MADQGAELNGHIDIAVQARDYLDHEAAMEGDPGGKLRDFVESLGVVIGAAVGEVTIREQLAADRDEWKRIAELCGEEVANWAHTAGTRQGKLDVLERRLQKAIEVAKAWRDQEGVNSALLDELAAVVLDG